MVERGESQHRSVKIGILGGTFDPIHYGHLIAANEALWALGLSQVLFVPAGVPPHKPSSEISSVRDRVAMVELAIASNSAFALSRVDVDRLGPAYSVDMIELLRSQLGPAAEFHFIIGLDTLLEIPSWREPRRLLALTKLAVVTRPGYPMPNLDDLEKLLPGVRQRAQFIHMPDIGISASELRRRVAVGQPITYQLPEAVESYIYREGLYRASGD